MEGLDIRRHVLVPKHEVATKKEVEGLLNKYKVTPHQLPLIKSSDPAAKAIGAKPGDVLKITRESQTAGRAITYRHVIEG